MRGRFVITTDGFSHEVEGEVKFVYAGASDVREGGRAPSFDGVIMHWTWELTCHC